MIAGTAKPLVPVAGPSTAMASIVPSAAERNKQWQRELLMERIRSHASQQKTFPELSKAMRMSMLEKRYALDAVEKSNLQKCLDSMQHCIKVTSRQGLVERLESLSRQLGLKFMEDTSGLFISTDMFFLEIILDANGTLTDVKVHHECKIEQQSCSELVNCLNRGDFADFTTQLEGLSSIYQLNAEPKVKTKAFVALQAMETDLYNIFQVQHFSKDTQKVLHESSVGIVMKRRGGHPMKLTYFVSPYDLISLETKTMQPLSVELVTSKHIGLSVTINLEASSANKLQILPTVTFAKDAQTGVEVPIYAPLTQLNSTLLPATFVLRLNKPIPVCYATLRALVSGGVGAGGADTGATNSSMESQHKTPVVSNIMNLIVQTASEQLLSNLQRGLFVCLPDQTHCYFFTENKQLKGTVVSSVPFTEPAQVPKILAFLKQQALFYTLLASCVRSQSKMGNDMDSTTILEVNATSFQQISVSLQHSYEESMSTIEFDLRNGIVVCTIYSPTQKYDRLSLQLTKTVQKSLSIPVTIRALLKFWDQERLQLFHRSIGGGDNGLSGSVGGSGGGGTSAGNGVGGGFGNFNLILGPNDPGGRGGNTSANGTLKTEQNACQQQMQMQSLVAASSAYKNEIKQEDFLECPKSHISPQSVDGNSLGHNELQQHESMPQKQQTATKATDIEIAGKYKNIWKNKTPNLKNCVSITPIRNEVAAAPKSLNVKPRTTGIEIIPLTTPNHSAGANIAGPTSTITITPITAASASGGAGAGAAKDKKSPAAAGNMSAAVSNSKRTLDVVAAAFDTQKEKKRKKKRDDSPMGPPEKVYSRQNSPAGTNDAAGTAVATRKFSPSSSPKGASGGMIGASATAAAGASLSTRPSPKHSPVYSSPKHNTSSNSPKSPFGTQSPKHGSSGKPSMSTLKSAAATSLSPKGGDAKSTSAANSANPIASSPAKSREKDKSALLLPTAVLSTAGASAALSPTAAAGSAVKANANMVTALQQFKSTAAHLANDNLSGGFGGASSAAAMDFNASMRKGVTSAVSLMTSTAVTAASTALSALQQQQQQQQQLQQQQQPPPQLQQQRGNNNQLAAGSSNSNNNNSSSSNLPSTEYMVKSSQEGLKLTINKTSNKSAKSKNNGSSLETTSAAYAKKQHTGLKPGVNSGPASKKASTGPTAATTALAAPASLSAKHSASHATKHMFQKSNSSGNLTGKSASGGSLSGLSKSTSASSFADLLSTRKPHGNNFNKKMSERERERSSSSSSSSQPATRLDHHVDMMKILQYASPTMAANMEGFIKGLNSKFHIPKLSQRTATTAAAVAAISPTTTNMTKMHTSSAPTTPTHMATAAAAASTALAATKTVAAMLDATYSKQQQHQQQHQHQQHVTNDNAHKLAQLHSQPQHNLKVTRSPPPPYHIAIAGSSSSNNSTAATTLPLTSSTANLSQSSVSVHILKSPTISVPPPETANERHQQSEHSQQQPVELLAKMPVDELLMASLGGE